MKKVIVLGVIALFVGMCFQPAFAVENMLSANIEKEADCDCQELDKAPSQRGYLDVLFAFIAGEIKDPYFHNNGLNFQMVNVTITGLFWVNRPYTFDFCSYRLNESWYAKRVLYFGINSYRMINPINLFEVRHVFGIISGSMYTFH